MSAANRNDPLWGWLLNAMPNRTYDGRYIMFSRRAAMADAAWKIAAASPQDAVVGILGRISPPNGEVTP